MANEIVRGRASDLPQARPEERAWKAAAEILDQVNDAYHFAVVSSLIETDAMLELRRAHQAIASMRLALVGLTDLAQDLEAFSRSATMKEIAQRVDSLTRTTRAGGIGDPVLFGRFLLDDVASREPTIGVLDRAVMRLRQTSEFMPSIAEVLKQIDVGAKELAAWRGMATKLSERIAKLDEQISKCELRKRMIACATTAEP